MWWDGGELRFKEPKAQAGGSTTAAQKLIAVAEKPTYDARAMQWQKSTAVKGSRGRLRF
jgi:hypothetical protein